MALIPPSTGGGGSDPADPPEVDITPDPVLDSPEPEPDDDPPTTPTGPDNPFNDAGSYDDSGGLSDSDDSDSESSDAPTTPTGVQNPFDWQVDDGDVTAPPESSVTDEGDVAGAGTVVEDDGSLDINPNGDTTVDPTDADYDSDPSSDGATERDSPDTALTGSFGGDSDESNVDPDTAEEIVDHVGSEAAGVTDDTSANETADSSGPDPMLLAVGAVAVGLVVVR